MHKLNEAVTRPPWLSNDIVLAPLITGTDPLVRQSKQAVCQHRMEEKSIEIKSVHRECEMRAKLNHVKMMMMMVKLYIRYISADVFVILLSSAASSPHQSQLKVARWERQISSLGG